MEPRHGRVGVSGHARPRNGGFTTLFLLSLVFGVLLVCVRGDFEADDLDDSYVLDVGLKTQCPEKVEFDGGFDKLKIAADEVEVNDEGCVSSPSGSTAEVQLSENPTGSYATRVLYANRSDVGDFLAGSVSGGTIACGGVSFPKGEELIFLQPDDDYEFTPTGLFGMSNTSLGLAFEEYTLKEDEKYVIVGTRCIYREMTLSDRICFPGEATVRAAGGRVVPMRDLQVGDSVVTDTDADAKSEPVLGFSHADRNAKTWFVEAHTKEAGKLVATPGHYVYAWTAASGKDMEEQLVQMRHLKVGDRLSHESGTRARITRIERTLLKTGTWNPHTASGRVVVNGFKASCYTAAVQPLAAHALLTPLRSAVGRLASHAWRALNAGCGLFQS